MRSTSARSSARAGRLPIWIAVLLVGLIATPGPVLAARLLVGVGQGALRELDPATGASTLIGAYGTDLPGKVNSYVGLAARHDGSKLYTLRESSVGGAFDTSLVAIDPATGTGTAFPAFDPQTLAISLPGFGTLPGVGARALAVSPLEPDVGIVIGWGVGPPENLFVVPYLWRVDLDTGLALGPATPTMDPRVLSLAFGPDGTSLYGTRFTGPRYSDEAQLAAIDPLTGAVSIIGDIGTSLGPMVYGLGFDPEDGTLYAAGSHLATLDPATGDVTSLGAPLAIAGANALAFIPEPTPGALTGLGLAALALGCRRRGRGQTRV